MLFYDLSGWNFDGQNLTGANFQSADLTGANLSAANLTDVNFSASTLMGADFSNAEIRGAVFHRDYFGSVGVSLAQLYSTASYQAGDLGGIDFSYNEFDGGNFARQNLGNANFGGATLTGANFREANLTNAVFFTFDGHEVDATLNGADFSAADVRGALILSPADGRDFWESSGATTTNLIRRDGHVSGLDLNAGALLVVRDYDGFVYDPAYPAFLIPITVDEHLTMGPGGTLQMVFEADAWDSTISFAPGIPVTLGGTLELTFADDVNLASQVGRTFDLFDWTGVTPAGAFGISSPYAWDLSNLYTTGEVTLTAVPEPATFALAALGFLILLFRCPPFTIKEESHAETQRRRGVVVDGLALRPQRLCVSKFSIAVCAFAVQALASRIGTNPD
jgi:uncharacterized protein YjbI with pentapeptide repeats